MGCPTSFATPYTKSKTSRTTLLPKSSQKVFWNTLKIFNIFRNSTITHY